MRSFAFALVAAGAAVTAFAAPASAQDSAPFAGAHVDALFGWDRFQKQGHDNGVLYGLGAGYDVNMGGTLVGIEGELNGSNVRRNQYDVLAAGDRLSTKAGRDLYIGGRIGKVVGGRTLLYAKAGYTNLRTTVSYLDGTQAGTDDFRFHRNLDGARVGAGAEYAIGPNSYLKAEYRYSNYAKGYTSNQVVGGFCFHF